MILPSFQYIHTPFYVLNEIHYQQIDHAFCNELKCKVTDQEWRWKNWNLD